MKFTAPVRRGILILLRYLEEDTPHNIHDTQHPMYRRLRGDAKSNLVKAINWLHQEGMAQHTKDAAKDAADAAAASRPLVNDGAVPDGQADARE